ncbi:MAG TPA: tetratricopeptide repeat protein [Bryobacteraceae bacterium]|nr:tetratricopeptide repeat protein [Bryobacteraceae bacterium]
MSRWVLALLLASAAPAFADDLKKQRPQPPASTQEEVPKEEDTAIGEKEYAFNPLQAEKEIRVGDFYFKKGKYRAAAERFREATKWNGGSSEAWLRLGEAEEKEKDPKAAKEAYAKYLDLSPDAKNAPEIRKKLEKLK